MTRSVVQEKLLAVTEAVWQISEMAREVLEKELGRRGGALATAKRETSKVDEALAGQVWCLMLSYRHFFCWGSCFITPCYIVCFSLGRNNDLI